MQKRIQTEHVLHEITWAATSTATFCGIHMTISQEMLKISIIDMIENYQFQIIVIYAWGPKS